MGLEMGPLSSPVVTSYRLPLVTVGRSVTVFAVLRLVTDRQTDGISLAKDGTEPLSTTVHRLPKVS